MSETRERRTHMGVIGCGEWGRNIVRDLLSLGCDVTVADPSVAGQERARALGAAVVARASDLPPVAGIVVVTPSTTHAAVIEELLERGVPIAVEKPFTTDGASARRIAARAPDRVSVLHKWRYHPGVEALAAIASSGELGPVVGLELTHVGWGCTQRDMDTVWTLLPHPLSIAIAVLGRIPGRASAVADAQPGAASAHGLIALLGDAPSPDDGTARPWVRVEVSSRVPEKRRSFRLLCRDGIAEVTDGAERAELVVSRPDAGPEVRPISGEQPLLREMRELVAHVRGGPAPRCTAAEGVLVVEAIERLRALAGLG